MIERSKSLYLWTVIHCTKETNYLSMLVYHAIMFPKVWTHFCQSLPNSFKYVLLMFTYILTWNIIRGWAIGIFGKGSNCLLSNNHMKLALEGSNLHQHVESLTQKKVLSLKKRGRKTVNTGESTDAFYCSEVQRVWSWEGTAWSIKRDIHKNISILKTEQNMISGHRKSKGQVESWGIMKASTGNSSALIGQGPQQLKADLFPVLPRIVLLSWTIDVVPWTVNTCIPSPT